MTDQLEHEAEEYFEEIERLGGVIQAIEKGYFQREIARSANSYQKLVDEKRLFIVGVNQFNKNDEFIFVFKDLEYEKSKMFYSKELSNWNSELVENSFVEFDKNSNFNLYKERSEEMYALYSGQKRISNDDEIWKVFDGIEACLLYTSPSPRD